LDAKGKLPLDFGLPVTGFGAPRMNPDEIKALNRTDGFLRVTNLAPDDGQAKARIDCEIDVIVSKHRWRRFELQMVNLPELSHRDT